MKKQFAIILLCLMYFSPAFAQSDSYDDTQEKNISTDEFAHKENQFETAMKLWLGDSKTLQQIVNLLINS